MDYEKIKEAAVDAMKDHMKPNDLATTTNIKKTIAAAIAGALKEYDQQKSE